MNNMVQPKLARFMKRPSELTVQDLEVATVQALKSKHQRVQRPLEVQGEPECSVVAPLETIAGAMLDAHAAAILSPGGRPSKPAAMQRGTYGGVDKSNRLEAGLPRRRHDVTPWAGLATVKFMEQERRKHADEDSWRRVCLLRYQPMTWQSLQTMYKKGLAFWEAKVKDCSVGKGSRGSLNKRGQNLKRTISGKTARGCRADGGGRTDRFKHFKVALKEWVKIERENGQAIDGHDMIEEFLYIVEKGVTYGEAMQTKSQLSPNGIARLLEYKCRVQNLKKKSYRKNYIKELMKFCGVRYLKPQRMLKLSYAEESVRCKITWQIFDLRMWEMAFSAEAMQKHVVQVEQFRNRIEDAVIVFSDQVPWWGLICRKKQMYMEHEFEGPPRKKQRLADAVPVVGAIVPFTQKRGWDNEEAMKFRITVELRQIIHRWFAGTEKDPIGSLGDTLIIVGGTHCRLSNISLAGKWIKDEKFYVGKNLKYHKAGNSVGNIMKSWRDLRDQRPDLFEGISLMQQPAAVVDSVITTWSIMEMAEKYPSILWQRDLSGGGGFSMQAKQAMRLAGQVPAWIAGKMTACLQITDTDFAFRLKAFATEAKLQMRTQLQASSLQAGMESGLRCGAFEILKIITDSVKLLKEATVKENLVLAAGRRNGILAWRPDMKAKKLVDCSEQEWCKKLPECGASHRLQRGWVEDRMKWLDSNGTPLEPDWSTSTLAKSVEDIRDLDAVASALDIIPLAAGELKGPTVKVAGQEFEMIQVALPMFESIEEGLEQDVARAVYLQMSVKERLMRMKVDEALKVEKKDDASAMKTRMLNKALRGRQVAAYLKSWTAEQRRTMEHDGVSRAELLDQLVPSVGGKPCDDPGKKAVDDFMKMHKKMEAEHKKERISAMKTPL